MQDDSDSPVHPGPEGPGAPPPPPRAARPDEWLFDQDGHVFGPFHAADLATLLTRGTLKPATRVRREGEAWRELRAVPELAPALRAWETRVRVERELRGERTRARRAVGARWTAVAVVVACVVALVVAAAGYLALHRPWERRSALLEGFEVSVTVGTGRVARADAAAADEIAVPAERPARREPPRAPAPRGDENARPRGTASAPPPAAGGLVAAEYDPAHIEQVVARSKETLAQCVRDEARRSPDLSGELPIEFAIGNDGRVAKLWIQDPRFRSDAFHACLLDALRRWSFHPFAGQRPIVALSFHLAPR